MTVTKTATIARASVKATTQPKGDALIKGANAEARRSAFYGIAPNSYSEGISRAAGLANFRAALGTVPRGFDPAKPAAHAAFSALLAAAKVEWLAGRACSRMPAGEFPKDCTDAIAKIDHARSLILDYAAPEAKSIKGRKGKRSVIQHKVIRAGEQALSVFLAELELSTAKKQSETDKAKRTRGASASKENQPKLVTPTHSELQNAPKPTTADDAHAFIDRQALMLGDYAKKHAKLICTGYGAAIEAMLAALRAEGKARDERKAAKAAGAHNVK